MTNENTKSHAMSPLILLLILPYRYGNFYCFIHSQVAATPTVVPVGLEALTWHTTNLLAPNNPR